MLKEYSERLVTKLEQKEHLALTSVKGNWAFDGCERGFHAREDVRETLQY